MSETPPLAFDWDGTAMVPRQPKRADQVYVVGQTYTLAEIQERSSASHAHFFARVNEAWQSLPDALMDEYPSAEALRKKMLVKAGYADERTMVCTSKAEAQRLAAFIRPIDGFAIVTVREAVVRVYSAQSQSYRAMGKQAFAESKEAVLREIDALLERKAA